MWCLCDPTPSDWHVIDHLTGGKLCDKSVEEFWELIENLALYDHEKNQVQCLMEAHLAPKPSIQVNKIASSCEICGGTHDTQYCMENTEQAFIDYASFRTDEAGGALPSDTVKNPKLNVNPTSSVSSTRS
ncbi:hypothetical protein Tco_0405679 [Tanacetum coccineum]